MLDWIKQGNNYRPYYRLSGYHPDVPDHPRISAAEGANFCLTSFPKGISPSFLSMVVTIGYGANDLLPGLYEYRRPGDNRVERGDCQFVLNRGTNDSRRVYLPYGELFTFSFFTYHEEVYFIGRCDGNLYRIGD